MSRGPIPYDVNMNDWVMQVAQWTGLSEDVVSRIGDSLVVLVIWLLIRILVMRLIRRRVQDVKRAYHIRRFANYILSVLLLIAITPMWVQGIEDLSTFLGLLSAGVAIALSDLLSNLAGWIFITARRPFAVGRPNRDRWSRW